MRLGDPVAIRSSLTVLSVFRVISIPGQLKLSTITDPFKGLNRTLPLYEIMEGIGSLSAKLPKLENFQPVRLHFSGSAGPNHPSSIQGIFQDVLAWTRRPDLLLKLQQYCNLLKGGDEFFKVMFPDSVSELKEMNSELTVHLGRLALKEEAAGKVRVFAITDCITQSVNKPLHLAIFSLLKRIPMDGTFDQLNPCKRLVEFYREGLIDEFYSYDLSAATDRLPIQIQTDILSVLFGRQFGLL